MCIWPIVHQGVGGEPLTSMSAIWLQQPYKLAASVLWVCLPYLNMAHHFVFTDVKHHCGAVGPHRYDPLRDSWKYWWCWYANAETCFSTFFLSPFHHSEGDTFPILGCWEEKPSAHFCSCHDITAKELRCSILRKQNKWSFISTHLQSTLLMKGSGPYRQSGAS